MNERGPLNKCGCRDYCLLKKRSYIYGVKIKSNNMQKQKIVFWLELGKGYTIEDVCLLCDYHARTGLMDSEMSETDIDRFAKKYMNGDYGLNGELDPAGGYGFSSHV